MTTDLGGREARVQTEAPQSTGWPTYPRPIEYRVEVQEPSGRWFISGAHRGSSAAQTAMRDCLRSNPKTAVRVVEFPSRRIVVMQGGEG